MNSEWKSKEDIYSILFNKILLKRNKNMDGINHKDIDNILLKILDSSESKIIYSEIMDGSGDTIKIMYYLYDIKKFNNIFNSMYVLLD